MNSCVVKNKSTSVPSDERDKLPMRLTHSCRQIWTFAAVGPLLRSLPFLTWRAFHGSKRGGTAWPCSMRCCFHTSSDSGPWRHVSGSCHSRGCALEGKHRAQIITPLFFYWVNEGVRQTAHYHPVLILLRRIVHRRVPGVGATSVDFANVKDPVSTVGGRKINCTVVQFWFSISLCSNTLAKKNSVTVQDFNLLTLLVFQKPCCLPTKREHVYHQSSILLLLVQVIPCVWVSNFPIGLVCASQVYLLQLGSKPANQNSWQEDCNPQSASLALWKLDGLALRI